VILHVYLLTGSSNQVVVRGHLREILEGPITISSSSLPWVKLGISSSRWLTFYKIYKLISWIKALWLALGIVSYPNLLLILDKAGVCHVLVFVSCNFSLMFSVQFFIIAFRISLNVSFSKKEKGKMMHLLAYFYHFLTLLHMLSHKINRLLLIL
jgi:hypothetical protein